MFILEGPCLFYVLFPINVLLDNDIATCDKMAEGNRQTGPCTIFNSPPLSEPDPGNASCL